MVSVTIQGGLGNQLFQFAAGYNLARSLGSELQLELSFYAYREPRQDFTPRTFLLSELGIPVRKLSNAEWVRRKIAPEANAYRQLFSRCWDAITGKPKRFVERIPTFDPTLFGMSGDIHLEGYFQDYRYIEESGNFIRQCISRATNPKRGRDTRVAEDAICLHVRRGDYVSRADVQELMGVCGPSYYQKAVAWLRREGVKGPVYAFSDEPEYVEKELCGVSNLRIVNTSLGAHNTIDDFLTMMRCKHFVISNSSYSFWAAWLGSDAGSAVCCPDPWYQKGEWQKFSPVPPSWIKFTRL
jgi:hypothetical protein